MTEIEMKNQIEFLSNELRVTKVRLESLIKLLISKSDQLNEEGYDPLTWDEFENEYVFDLKDDRTTYIVQGSGVRSDKYTGSLTYLAYVDGLLDSYGPEFHKKKDHWNE